MGSKLYVGGLPYATTELQLHDLFAQHGTVESARVITDKFTGQSRGFGFVEMSTAEEANAAVTALNGTQLDGRTLTVNNVSIAMRSSHNHLPTENRILLMPSVGFPLEQLLNPGAMAPHFCSVSSVSAL